MKRTIMITLSTEGAYVLDGTHIFEEGPGVTTETINQQLAATRLELLRDDSLDRDIARQGTMAHAILTEHNQSGEGENLSIRFDSLATHDITYVGIIQTARASGMEQFPVPLVLTNCHNSLCAVGGTINEDDHQFGLSAARKYGGIFVPTHLAVIHQYAREMMSGCGKMILGSDSHTRYGALGTMAIGEGGPEIVKQLLEKTYDIPRPQVIGVYLEGTPPKGTGPHDVALAIIGAVFKNGYVKNKVMEFFGPGVAGLPIDFRNGIDVMTTETTCLSSIWQTDGETERFFQIHGRPEAYQPLQPERMAYYDGLIRVNLSEVTPMIALPFHPSNVYEISEFKENAHDIARLVEQEAEEIFEQNISYPLGDKIDANGVKVDQGVIAGCAGGLYDNLRAAADIIANGPLTNSSLTLSAYPASQPVNLALMKSGAVSSLVANGVITRTAFCGPCFGAGDTPASSTFSVRHTTRNFPNREGSKPGEGQISGVALMDARSIAATFANGGYLTSAAEFGEFEDRYEYEYHPEVYAKKVYFGYGSPAGSENLVMGPNIKNWPTIDPLPDNLLLKVVSVITDPVTTTDELIPSGEASSFRSNPLRLAEFTLSRKDPAYVERAKGVQELYEQSKKADTVTDLPEEIRGVYATIVNQISTSEDLDSLKGKTGIGSLVKSIKPGDGSAREQAASCQKVLGTWANLAQEYATKRYRSNCINWGILPLIGTKEIPDLSLDSYLYLPGIKTVISSGEEAVEAWLIEGSQVQKFTLSIPDLTGKDREILLAGNLINFHAG